MDINLGMAFDSPTGADDEDFEAFLELILEELERIGRDDIEMSASLAKRTAVFTVFDDGETPSADKFLSDIRTALHAANCSTPGWEQASLKLEAESTTSELASA